jgi:thiamine-monophosphate kinase
MAKRRTTKPSGEDLLIANYFKPIARHPGARGLVDDAAYLTPPKGHELVLKTDAIVGSVHFFIEDPPDTVARKALGVNLSDLASKGAKPAGFLLTLALPKDYGHDWLKAFARGLGAMAKRYDCPLLGGDTVMTPGPVMISIAAFGTIPKGAMVERSGAKAGDIIVVTGTIGDAALGLKLRTDIGAIHRWKLDTRMKAHLAQRYLVPRPRNAVADAVRRYANGAMDVSDGLAGDLGKLVRASGVGAEVEAERVPLSRAARHALAADPGALETILTGGDDFEVLATVPPKKLAGFMAAARRARVPATAIGRVTAGQGTRFIGFDGEELSFRRVSFSHF